MASLSCNSGAYTIEGATAFRVLVMAAAVGSYLLTGTAVTPVRGHPITAVSGSYTVTGTLIQSRRISAFPAGYILNGQAVTLSRSNIKKVTATPGSYAVTGGSTIIEHAILTNRGQYTVTGTATTLTRNSSSRTVVAGSGSYSSTGGSTILELVAPIGTGDYQVTGTAVTLRKGKGLIALSRAFTLAGTQVLLEQSKHFPVGTTSYSYTGSQTNLVYSGSHAKAIVINNGIFNLTGTAASIYPSRLASVVSGSYSITGSRTITSVNAVSGVYSITGTPVTFSSTNRLIAVSGVYSITGIATPLIRPTYRLVMSPGVYLQAAPVTRLVSNKLITPDSGIYTVSKVSTLLRATRITVESGMYSMVGVDTTLIASLAGRWREQQQPAASVTTQPVPTSIWTPQPSPQGA